jgi:cell division septation protein DedD
MYNPENQQPKTDKPVANADLDYLAWLTLMAMEARDAKSVTPPAPVQQPQVPPPPVQQPQYVPPVPVQQPQYYISPPPIDVEVRPGLPNPNSNRIYHLQVGAYTGDGALRVIQQLRAAGFEAFMEHIGNNIYRVAVIGIPAQYVYGAAQRLGAIGFRQILVRE